MAWRIELGLALVLASACGSTPVAPDGGADGGIDARVEPDSGAPCEQNSDCDDGVFCNGPESCIDTVCVAGEAPCDAATEVCDETTGRCQTADCSGAAADQDTDGYISDACPGGDDCDDSNGNINPRIDEDCVYDDPTDEDCDPRTFGWVDIDMDGAADARCYNVDERDGMRYGGTDCNDNNASIHPLATERCDGSFDEDCDGMVDEDCLCSPEGSTRACGTGLGDCAGAVETCTASGWGPCSAVAGTELCDGSRDEDCDGTVDEGCECVTGTTRGCGMGACVGTQRCAAGMWDACDGASPATETCNGVDDDCNGTLDDVAGLGSSCGSSTGICRPGTLSCVAGSSAPTCGGSGYVAPGTEVCDHLDNDCDGSTDDGVYAGACTRTFPPTGGGLGSPLYYCLPSASSCSGTLASGTSGGEVVRGAFTSWRGDLGRANLFRARVNLRDSAADGIAPNGWVTFWLTTDRVLGSDAMGPGGFGAAHGIPIAPASSARSILISLSAGASAPLVMVWNGGGWITLGSGAEVLPASCRTIPTTATGYTFEISNEGPRFIARLTRDGCGSATVDVTPTGVWDSLYGSGPTHPTYYLGVVGDNDDDFAISVTDMYVDRRVRTLSDRNNCNGC